LQFTEKVQRYSSTRFNAIITMIKAAVPAAARLKRRRIQVRDRGILSTDGYRRLLDELDTRPRSHAGLVVRFLAHTGFRINEARQLKWKDVFEDHIFAPAEITKNGRPRRVPFIAGLPETLQDLKRITGRCELILPQAEVKGSLHRACRKAGIDRLSHHDFRHLYATRCIQSGVDLPTVARWLGHLDGGALLARVYYHLADEHGRRMAAQVRI
jgi:integrase